MEQHVGIHACVYVCIFMILRPLLSHGQLLLPPNVNSLHSDCGNNLVLLPTESLAEFIIDAVRFELPTSGGAQFGLDKGLPHAQVISTPQGIFGPVLWGVVTCYKRKNTMISQNQCTTCLENISERLLFNTCGGVPIAGQYLSLDCYVRYTAIKPDYCFNVPPMPHPTTLSPQNILAQSTCW